MKNQRQIGEYIPDKSAPARFVNSELVRRRDGFLSTGIGLVTGNWLWQMLPGKHDWSFAFTVSYYETFTLLLLWCNLRAADNDTRIWVEFFRLFRLRRSN